MAKNVSAALLSLIATLCFGFGFGFGDRDGRTLSSLEQASLVGGYQNITLNACCAPVPACTVPSTLQCSTTLQYYSCLRGLARAYLNTPNNQNSCSGTKTSQICSASYATMSCIDYYVCSFDTQSSTCYLDLSTRATPYSEAPTSCAPTCP